jgi:hypothetical protein
MTLLISQPRIIRTTRTINRNLSFSESGKFIINPNVTLTINRNITADQNQQIFQYTDNTAKISGINNDQVYASWWGAKSDNTTNNTLAFQAISQYLNDNNGGHLILSEGTYLVGIQNRGVTNAYQEEPIIDIRNTTNPVIIDGRGATIKRIDGLRYGSFDKNTELPVNHPDYGPAPNYSEVQQYGFYDYQYQSSLAYGILYFQGNQNITVQNLNIDGNLENTIIGGYFSDVYQVMGGMGIAFLSNEKVDVTNVASINNPADGFYVAYAGQLEGDPDKPHTLINVAGNYNGRQGLSWVGGNGLKINDSEFSYNAKSLFAPPGAGIDIEPEETILTRGYFQNIETLYNGGAGLLIDTANFSDLVVENSILKGDTYYPFYMRNQDSDRKGIKIIDSQIYGTTMIHGVRYDSPEDSLLFQNVAFYAYSENADDRIFLVYGNHLIEAGYTKNIRFIDSTAHTLNPYFGYFHESESNIFENFQLIPIEYL